MILIGKVVGKCITGNGVFTRIRLDCNGWPKAAMMRFFDIPDQENFEIGQKIQIDLYVPKIQPFTPGYLTLSEILQADLEPLPGCESPANSKHPLINSTEIGVAPIVMDETGDARFDIENIPLPAPTKENMRERPYDEPGLSVEQGKDSIGQ